jgi:heat shock protein HslJ
MMSESLEGVWRVELMATEEGLSPLVEGSEILVEMAGDRVSGRALNRFTGSLGGGRPFGVLATTRMAGPPEIMSQEEAFLKYLQSVDHVAAERVNLEAAGRVVLVLRRGGSQMPPEP